MVDDAVTEPVTSINEEKMQVSEGEFGVTFTPKSSIIDLDGQEKLTP